MEPGNELDAELDAPKKTRASKTAEVDESDLDIETQLRKLFDENDDMVFNVVVQKYNPQTKTYPQITSYRDISDIENVISTEEIGRQFGSGKYKLIVKYIKKSGEPGYWGRVFELDKAYDKFLNPAQAQPQPQANAGAMTAADMLAIMSAQSERTMQMMAAMMTNSQNAIQGIVAAMAAGRKEENVNIELLKEAMKNSKVDVAGQLNALVGILEKVKNLNAPQEQEDEEYGGEPEEEGEQDDPLTQLGKGILPSIGTAIGEMLNPPKEQPRRAEAQ